MFVNAKQVLENGELINCRIDSKDVRQVSMTDMDLPLDADIPQWKIDLVRDYGDIYEVTFSNGDCYKYAVKSKYIGDLMG